MKIISLVATGFAFALSQAASAQHDGQDWLNVPGGTQAECEGSVLAAKYSRMLSDDQALRGRYIEILERENAKVSVDAAEKAKIEDLILAGDLRNQEELDRLIKLYGWPKSIDDGKAVRSAYFIIQHAPLPYQLRYRPVVRGANKRGEIRTKKWLPWKIVFS